MMRSRWIPVAGWAGVILAATSIPTVPASPAAGTDKLVHLVMYGVLGLLAVRAAGDGANATRIALLTLLAVAAFGALDEWHQQFIPNRSADVADWLADVAGAALGIALFATLKLRRIKGT